MMDVKHFSRSSKDIICVCLIHFLNNSSARESSYIWRKWKKWNHEIVKPFLILIQQISTFLLLAAHHSFGCEKFIPFCCFCAFSDLIIKKIFFIPLNLLFKFFHKAHEKKEMLTKVIRAEAELCSTISQFFLDFAQCVMKNIWNFLRLRASSKASDTYFVLCLIPSSSKLHLFSIVMTSAQLPLMNWETVENNRQNLAWLISARFI